jgi:ADP-heptose:LPS heptosyltransferase
MQKLILVNYQSPGDAVMLTAAVRDLHHCYPGQFITDVRTGSPDLWQYNSHVTPLDDGDPEVRTLDCHYPLIHFSNQRPLHFLYGFIDDLNEQLGLRIRPTRFAGDIHLSEAEKAMPSQVERITGQDLPYWIIVAGGKFDYTIKWWHFRRWQAVVDHFRGKILFVQVGEKHHYHPALNGVIDLRGKTDLRELIRLVYHAAGVLCPVTLHMHLAAAVECKRGDRLSRPCVVVAGGREPPSWEAYPTHQFIHTVGALPCCATGGCWRSRSVPLGDGDEKDQPRHLCLDTVKNLPRCMHLITPEAVIERIEIYEQGASANGLTAEISEQIAPFLSEPATLVAVAGTGTRTLSLQSRRGTKRNQTNNNQLQYSYARPAR